MRKKNAQRSSFCPPIHAATGAADCRKPALLTENGPQLVLAFAKVPGWRRLLRR
jgi:hypothetical protein